MKLLRNISRLLIAPVFIFSGFVKAIDPLGSTYKFSDYFHAFGMDFMTPIAPVLAIVLSTTELLIGINLLLGFLMRFTSWTLMIFMSFFTVLTLISAITNPVTDCGCFGDALILTNWQTFFKNVFFMLPTLVVFFQRRKFGVKYSMPSEWGFTLLFIGITIVISATCLRNLPFIDFRPYKIGTNIPQSMELPEGAHLDEYESILVYEKDGVQKEFELDSIPWKDTTWKWVETKNVLVKKGDVPPIHDFGFTSLTDGSDLSDSILHSPNYSLLVVTYDIRKASEEGLIKVNSFANSLRDYGIEVLGMTASLKSDIETYKRKHNLNIDFYNCDEIALKTSVRSNPGVMLLKDGVILGKWNYRALPDIENIDDGILSVVAGNKALVQKKWILSFFLIFLAILLLLPGVILKKNYRANR